MELSEKAREILIEKLDEYDWDLSDDGLDEVARDMQDLFPSFERAREFVESNASSLFELMQEDLRDRYKR